MGMVHTLNPSIWEAEGGRSLSLRTPWSTEWVPGQPVLHRETLSWKTKKQKNKKKEKDGIKRVDKDRTDSSRQQQFKVDRLLEGRYTDPATVKSKAPWKHQMRWEGRVTSDREEIVTGERQVAYNAAPRTWVMSMVTKEKPGKGACLLTCYG